MHQLIETLVEFDFIEFVAWQQEIETGRKSQFMIYLAIKCWSLRREKNPRNTGENQPQLYSHVATHPNINPFGLGLTLDHSGER